MDQPLDSKEAMRKQVILELIQQMKEQLAPKGPGVLEISLESHKLPMDAMDSAMNSSSDDESKEDPKEEASESSDEESQEDSEEPSLGLGSPDESSKDDVLKKLKERQQMKGGY